MSRSRHTAAFPFVKKVMNTNDTRAQLEGFGARYSYDVGYLLQILNDAPEALKVFEKAQGLSQFREALPLDAHYLARIGATWSGGCGACANLNARMALEAAVERDLISDALEDPARLSEPLRLVFEHARSVPGDPVDEQRLAAIREVYGPAGAVELALVIAGCRIYPTLKHAMGRSLSTAAPSLD